jgi:hypothetical protein
MALDYLHNHPNFSELIQIISQEHAIEPSLVENTGLCTVFMDYSN